MIYTNKFIDSNVVIYAFTKHKLSEKCKDLLIEDELFTNILVESFSKISTISNEEHDKKS